MGKNYCKENRRGNQWKVYFNGWNPETKKTHCICKEFFATKEEAIAYVKHMLPAIEAYHEKHKEDKKQYRILRNKLHDQLPKSEKPKNIVQFKSDD